MAEEKSQAEASVESPSKSQQERVDKQAAAAEQAPDAALNQQREQWQRDASKTAVADPAAVPRSDGWTTDSSPEPQPQRVLEDDARRAAAAQTPESPGAPPERAMAPGSLEFSEELRTERAEGMEKRRVAQEKAAAEQAQKKP